MVVEKARSVIGIFCFRPVVEQHRNSAEHLHTHPMFIALVHSHFGVPTVIFYLAKKFIVNHHPCAAVLVMIQMNVTLLVKLFRPARNVFWNYVCMNINLTRMHGDKLKN